ncbi:MAG: hypothetical protein L0099_05815 [Acidobacteria bacterium]|nr:hypothetical protein [Acidobacteriota bacterium]
MTDALIASIFAASQQVRYVAVYGEDGLRSQARSDLSGASSCESDRYEELLVNPALLTLATQRGNLDCGGMRFLIVAYGNFYQLLRPLRRGHLSVCLERASDPVRVAALIEPIVALRDPAPWPRALEPRGFS